MIKNFLLLTLFTYALFAQEYPSFTSQELQNLDRSDRIAKNRILDYEKQVKICSSLPRKKQLQKINFYLNTLLPQYDAIINKKEDNWATPKEFLRVGYGDCEDYVIIKYYTLIHLGFDEKKLFITVVKEKFYGGYHMVLSYFKYKGKSPLVLDNLSFKILPMSKRSDLEAQYYINSTGVYKLLKNNQLHKVADKYKEFEELQKKVSKNN